jgi:hypothetical protein
MKLQLIRYNSSYYTDKSLYRDVTSDNLNLLLSGADIFSGKLIFDEFDVSLRYDRYAVETQMWYYQGLTISVLAGETYTDLDYYDPKTTLPLRTFKIKLK